MSTAGPLPASWTDRGREPGCRTWPAPQGCCEEGSPSPPSARGGSHSRTQRGGKRPAPGIPARRPAARSPARRPRLPLLCQPQLEPAPPRPRRARPPRRDWSPMRPPTSDWPATLASAAPHWPASLWAEERPPPSPPFAWAVGLCASRGTSGEQATPPRPGAGPLKGLPAATPPSGHPAPGRSRRPARPGPRKDPRIPPP